MFRDQIRAGLGNFSESYQVEIRFSEGKRADILRNRPPQSSWLELHPQATNKRLVSSLWERQVFKFCYVPISSTLSVSRAEKWKMQQGRTEGRPQAPGQPRPNICFPCCLGCYKCFWNEDLTESSEMQTFTKRQNIEQQHSTLDEVNSWSESLEILLGSPAGREVFLEFLRSECSENNLMFWIACEELKTETNPSTTAAKARTIYHEYLARFSQNKVSLDTQVHDRILQNLKEPSSTIYDEAQLQIYDLMRRDSFPGFLKSSVYINFLSKKSKFLDTHVFFRIFELRFALWEQERWWLT
ncbi:Regulator of G-protein signaling 17 [Labeo rohita]|uniref:Regulator of G-protein signaling 17 n=1 Tax=Labeo rohita TaxID=84645 RepID=A0ABQ8M9P3_LABRO|nr:Regulator of G-protein signaling 17 [Labeo rohita]